jgi:hypothetical protein
MELKKTDVSRDILRGDFRRPFGGGYNRHEPLGLVERMLRGQALAYDEKHGTVLSSACGEIVLRYGIPSPVAKGLCRNLQAWWGLLPLILIAINAADGLPR